jgi:archaellum component FlaF (FlaF/FlaG flagellin family)
MKFHACHLNRRQNLVAGFTLIEMMMSVGLGLLLLVGVAILYINGNESFVAMANYQNLDRYSASALDILSREIRNASAVTATNASSITLTNATQGKTIIITYSSTDRTLVLSGTQILAETGQSAVTNLIGCDSWSYSMYDRAPTVTSTNIIFNGTNNMADCKLIQMNWKCSRTILGAKLTTESVQTAQIVLRNKTQ